MGSVECVESVEPVESVESGVLVMSWSLCVDCGVWSVDCVDCVECVESVQSVECGVTWSSSADDCP